MKKVTIVIPNYNGEREKRDGRREMGKRKEKEKENRVGGKC